MDHIWDGRGLQPKYFGGKGSETFVSDHILEERGLKSRFQTTHSSISILVVLVEFVVPVIHMGGNGSETLVSKRILEEKKLKLGRGLKSRSQITCKRKGVRKVSDHM